MALTALSGAAASPGSQAPQEPVPLPLTPAELPGIPATLDGDWHWRGAGREGVLRVEGPSAVLIHGDGTASPFGRPSYTPSTGRVWFDLDDGALAATGLVFGGVMQGTLVWRAYPPFREEPWCASRVPGCVPGQPLPEPSPIEKDTDTAAAAPAAVEPAPVLPEATQLTVQAGSRRVAAGDTCWVPIRIRGAAGLERLAFMVAYPPDVVTPVLAPEPGFAAPPDAVAASVLRGGAMHVVLDRLGGFTGAGIAIQVPLKAVGLSGTRAPLDVRIVSAVGAGGQPLDAAAAAGLLQIVSNASPDPGSALAGDADGDGEVTAADALVAARMAHRAQPSRLAADADADGYVTAEDARLILKRVAGTQEVRRD